MKQVLKELRVQKNNILDRMSAINEKCVAEKRKRNMVEQMEFDKLERELAEVEFSIENEQRRIRSGCVCTTSETRKDDKKMTTDFQKAISREGRVDLTETRANTATQVEGTHQVVQTPGRFVDQVYMDAVHGNLLLSLCTVFQTEENNRILVGERLGKMQQLGELDEIDDKNFVTNEHALVPERYGVANTISRHLINTQGFDVQAHVQRLFAQSLAETMEELIANALDAVDEGLTVVDINEAEEHNLLQEIVKVLAVQPESLRANSVIVMHPQMYAKMLTMEDAVGRSLLDYSYDQSLRAKICGVPVIVSAEVDQNNVYVGSLKDAVVAAVNIQNFESEQKPRANAVSFFMNVYAGAVVKQPAALTRIAFYQE